MMNILARIICKMFDHRWEHWIYGDETTTHVKMRKCTRCKARDVKLLNERSVEPNTVN